MACAQKGSIEGHTCIYVEKGVERPTHDQGSDPERLTEATSHHKKNNITPHLRLGQRNLAASAQAQVVGPQGVAPLGGAGLGRARQPVEDGDVGVAAARQHDGGEEPRGARADNGGGFGKGGCFVGLG